MCSTYFWMTINRSPQYGCMRCRIQGLQLGCGETLWLSQCRMRSLLLHSLLAPLCAIGRSCFPCHSDLLYVFKYTFMVLNICTQSYHFTICIYICIPLTKHNLKPFSFLENGTYWYRIKCVLIASACLCFC